MQLTGLRPEALRFAFSPVQEMLRALGVFSNPRRHAEQMEWVREARRRATPALKREIKRFGFFFTPAANVFPEILPVAEAGAFEPELQVLRAGLEPFTEVTVRRLLGKPLVEQAELRAAARPASLRRLIAAASKKHPEHAAFLSAFGASPARELAAFCDVLGSFFERCVEPYWDDLQSRALDDAQARKALLGRFGLTGMLRTLTRQISVTGDAAMSSVQFGGDESAHVSLAFDAGAILTLTPSYFIWPNASFLVLRRRTLDVRIAYPLASPAMAQPRARAWETAAKRFAALGDPTRLQMLDLLADRDLSTREFAGLIGLSESGVSRHLSILRDADLVTSVRDGYFVLYRRTELAARYAFDK